MKRILLSVIAFFLLFTLAGCDPFIIGSGAVGGYKMATDERPIGQQVDDVTLTARIKARLIDDPTVPARKIDVDIVNGNVILTGVVDTEAQAAKAVSIAQKIEGVNKVTDNMQIGTITMRERLNDTVLVSKINARLLQEPGVQSMQIDVDADRGVVTLTGLTDTKKTKDRIIDIARTTPGVVKVIDNLSH